MEKKEKKTRGESKALRGRPRLPKSERRSRYIGIAFTEQEFEDVQKIANKLGTTISSHIREQTIRDIKS